MTDKELKRLCREELLQLMILQAEENKRLKEEVEQLRRQMEQNQIMMNEAGSIAEASLLHQVFETAQAAANTYLDNIRQMHNRQQAYCNGLIARANEEALEIIRKAKERYEDEV